jgi:hypothetical protein
LQNDYARAAVVDEKDERLAAAGLAWGRTVAFLRKHLGE